MGNPEFTLIYGYENPYFHIQLCDGQQRLTTLFLLMGMINRRTEGNQFKNILIAEAEFANDREPNLQYAIRESTLYFLSDLVCEFFLNSEVKIEDIKNQDWYFSEYDLDASIQSILCAIKIIDAKIKKEDCSSFGKFITQNLQVLYYDMGHRTRGEETFVVINTTGEPLTATENLKPILIGNIKEEGTRKKASKEWEDREEWFWQNKEINEQTSDKGLNDFFIWFWQIRLLQEKTWKGKDKYSHNPHELFQKKPLSIEGQDENPDVEKWEESKNVDTVHGYFTALKELVGKCNDEQIKTVLKTIKDGDISLSWFRGVSLDVVLPLIAYVQKFPESLKLYQFVRRIRKNYFYTIWKEREHNYLDWRHIVQIIEFSESEEDVLKFETKSKADKFKKIPNVTLNEWYSEEEKIKNRFDSNRAEIEQWEDHDDFMGDLSFLISISKNHEEDITLESLKRYFNNYINVIDSIRKRTDIAITNTYRLFLLYIGCEKVEHKKRVSWNIEGILFSKISREHLAKDEFKQLCFQRENEIEAYCLTYFKNKIEDWNLFDLDKDNFTTEKALKCWLTLKVLHANEQGICLLYDDGAETGVSVYRDANENRIIESEPFSIYNMISGFGVKVGGSGSYIRRTIKFNSRHNTIDTPFDEIDMNLKSGAQLEGNKKVIENILSNFNLITPCPTSTPKTI